MIRSLSFYAHTFQNNKKKKRKMKRNQKKKRKRKGNEDGATSKQVEGRGSFRTATNDG